MTIEASNKNPLEQAQIACQQKEEHVERTMANLKSTAASALSTARHPTWGNADAIGPFRTLATTLDRVDELRIAYIDKLNAVFPYKKQFFYGRFELIGSEHVESRLATRTSKVESLVAEFDHLEKQFGIGDFPDEPDALPGHAEHLTASVQKVISLLERVL